MDPQEVIKPKIAIPENPHTDVEDAAQFNIHPVIDQLADAGHSNSDGETFMDHLRHLDSINEEFNKAHVREDGQTQQPSEKSIQQVEQITPVTSGDTDSTPAVPIDAQPVDQVLKQKNGIFFPIKNIASLIKTGIISFLTKRGSANNPEFNGRTTAAEALQLKNGTI